MHMFDTTKSDLREAAADARRRELYPATDLLAGDYGRHAFGGRFGLVPSAAVVDRVRAERAGARS